MQSPYNYEAHVIMRPKEQSHAIRPHIGDLFIIKFALSSSGDSQKLAYFGPREEKRIVNL